MRPIARYAALPLALLLAIPACIPVRPPAPAVDPQGAPITTAQIVVAKRESKQTLYSILWGLGGGALGVLAGGKIGYEIGYAHDIRAGCEDCGLNGLLLGAGLGLAAGLTVGGNLGMHAGARADRADAVERIILERARRNALRYLEKNSHIVGAPAAPAGIVVTPRASSESRSTLSNW